MAGVIIYALCDPDTEECRYVGKTVNLKVRINGHRWEAKSSNLHNRKINWLRSLTNEPIVKVLQITDLSNWQVAEKWWISEMRKRGVRLTNYADGGQTSPVEGKGHTVETKAKLRALALERGCKPPSRKGVPLTDGQKEKLREITLRNGNRPPPSWGWNKGKKMAPEYCEKNRLGHIGIPWSSARREAQNKIKNKIMGVKQ